MSRHGKGKPHIHPAGIALDRHVDKRVDLGKIHNGIKTAPDFLFLHTYNCAIEIDVFTTREFGMKACTHFQKRADAAVNLPLAEGRLGYAGENLEKSTFPGAIMSDYTDNLTLIDSKGNILQCPKTVFTRLRSLLAPEDGLQVVHELIPQRIVTVFRCSNIVLLGNVFHSDCGIVHADSLSDSINVSNNIGKTLLHLFEVNYPAEQQDHNNRRAYCHYHEVGAFFTKKCPTETFDHTSHWIKAI